jgi:hypothetical protein
MIIQNFKAINSYMHSISNKMKSHQELVKHKQLNPIIFLPQKLVLRQLVMLKVFLMTNFKSISKLKIDYFSSKNWKYSLSFNHHSLIMIFLIFHYFTSFLSNNKLNKAYQLKLLKFSTFLFSNKYLISDHINNIYFKI